MIIVLFIRIALIVFFYFSLSFLPLHHRASIICTLKNHPPSPFPTPSSHHHIPFLFTFPWVVLAHTACSRALLSFSLFTLNRKHLTQAGWFNSIADLAKRRFASFVKVNLASTSEKRPKDKHLQNQMLQQQQQQQLHQQYPFTSGNGSVMSSMNNFNHTSTNPFVGPPSGIPSAIPPSAAAHVLGNDRRHRSPDPPPRFVLSS